jgi:hypothetical protein
VVDGGCREGQGAVMLFVRSFKGNQLKLNIFCVLSLPISFVPFELLIFTSIMLPQASFIGHLSGIIVGYSIA